MREWLNPDFAVTGTVLRGGVEVYAFRTGSPHRAEAFRADPLHAALLCADGTPAPPPPPLSAEAVRDVLRARLPAFMLPETIAIVDALPLTPNGKLDRAALARGAAKPAAPPTEEPASELERVILGIWRAVLGRDAIGRDDNFFDVGGHSLRMAQVQSRLTAATGREIRW